MYFHFFRNVTFICLSLCSLCGASDKPECDTRTLTLGHTLAQTNKINRN